MSISQFRKWLRRQGVTRGKRCYIIPCKGAAVSTDDAARRLRVTISTRTRDRHGDILEPGGARIADFLKNPVVLWAHEYSSLPIGRATALVRDGDSLKADIEFAPTEFARQVYDLYSKGFLKAWSVGFLPLEWDVIEDEAGKFAGYHIRSWELVELSAVPVPANPDALTNAIADGLVTEPALVKSLREAVAVSAATAPEADARPDAVPGEPGDRPPEVSIPALAEALAAKLAVRLRPCLGDAVAREIRRQQGRLD